MSRRKLTDEEKIENARIAEQERIQRLVDSSFEKSLTVMKYRPAEPTITYKVGERVFYGNHERVEVSEVREGGRVILLHLWVSETRDKIAHERDQWVFWSSILPYVDNEVQLKRPILKYEPTYHAQVQNRSLSGIVHSLQYFGYDDNMDYQRDLVWTLDQKQALIHSILNSIDIGKFALVENSFSSGKAHYDILDGKQRLNAIMDFLENRFTYKGLHFHELHPYDQGMILNKNTPIVITTELSKAQRYEYFLSLNTGGTAQCIEHINHVKNLLNKEMEK